MKLSQLTTDEALDVLCELTPYVSNIVSDEQTMKTLGKAVNKKNMTRAGLMVAGAERLNGIVQLLLKSHRKDVYGIISAVNRVEPAKIAAQSVMETMAQVQEIFQDKELLDFFKSFAPQGKSA